MFSDAIWIAHPEDGRENHLVPVFRRRFQVKDGLEKAVLRVSAHGVYETEINGRPVTQDRFTPGLTSYYVRIQYQEYDVTALLREGENVWISTVGDGWWRWKGNFGQRLALWGYLTLQYRDHTETVVTDRDFEVGTGPVISADLQAGEVYDARIRPHGWRRPVAETVHTEGKLIPSESVPVREKETFAGRCGRDSAGNRIVDFGQNIAGFVRMRLFDTRPGQKVRIRHGENLDTNGKFSTGNCSGGKTEFQEVTYICRGAAVEEYAPHFAFFGFRYIEVTGAEKAEFTASAVYSDLKETMVFSCSDPLINRLVENARWSQKGNFLDVMTDCPTRERNAWTGDAMIYCRTAAYFMDVYPFFRKQLKDMSAEQFGNGRIGLSFPSTTSVHDSEQLRLLRGNPAEENGQPDENAMIASAGPAGNGNAAEDSTGWGDSAVLIPYEMYLMYGRKEILSDQYDAAKRWTDHSLKCMRESNPLYRDRPWYSEGNGDLIYDTRFHFGEWCELARDPYLAASIGAGGTVSDFVSYVREHGRPEEATAYTAHSCEILSRMAGVLGYSRDENFYRTRAEKIREAYDRYLIDSRGVICRGRQAPYVRALAFHLVSDRKKPLVVDQLKREIDDARGHLNTGFLSSGLLLPVLCENGLSEEAYRILEQEDYPSWLHTVRMGATTIPERWDGFDHFKDSLNHCSFGSVCRFLFEYAAGIRPRRDCPGFGKFDLHPVIGGKLTSVSADYHSVRGTIHSCWKRTAGHFEYECGVPSGTAACLTLPDGRTMELAPGEYRFEGQISEG
ncbi:MAG: family 78 glycoside hydrolase catalytic domain [Lachnospiraceae bacterium]|jgi:alpha-L-rhamnosidase